MALAVLLVGASYTDIRTGKIKNVLTFPIMLCGILMAPFSAPHWYDGITGLFAAFGLGVVLWKFGGAYHAGDVKLAMAAGTLLGPENVLRGMLIGLVLSFPVSLAVLLMKGRLKNLWTFWVKGDRTEVTRMIFGPVIAIGMIAARIQPFPNLWGIP